MSEIEEINKVRASLGLRPLSPEPEASGEGKAEEAKPVDQDALAEDNYNKKREEDRRNKEEKEIKARIAKMQNKRNLARKLQGPTLSDADALVESSSSGGDSSKSALKWLKQQKKRAAENAFRLAKEQEEAEALALKSLRESANAYSGKDLTGLKVGHDIDDLEMEEGDERILTLKDKGVLDEDGEDELVEEAAARKEEDRRKEERKKGAKEYTGLDDEEFGGDGMPPDGSSRHGAGHSRSVLSKYDGDLDREGMAMREDGKSGFVLGALSVNKDAEKRKRKEEEAKLQNKQLRDLSYEKNREVSDYLQEGDVGFKKPKTKKKRAAKVRLDLEDDDRQYQASGSALPSTVKSEEAEDVDMAGPSAPLVKRRGESSITTENFVDDDELAASLARSRRQKAKKTFNKVTPEEIAKNLAAQRKAEEAAKAQVNGSATHSAEVNGDNVKQEEGATQEEDLVFDNTIEFVRNISIRSAADRQEASENEERRRRARSAEIKREASGTPHPPTATINGHADDAMVEDEPADTKKRVKIEEPPEEGEEMDVDEIQKELDAQKRSRADQSPSPDFEEPTASEHLVSGGMAATMAMLRNSGALEQVTDEVKFREAEQRKYDKWLSERREEERRREQSRAESKAVGSAKDQATREWENRQREIDEARSVQDKFKDYKPDVDIKYHDKFGRQLGMKEAWKNLSHTFHGKMPGHKKQEKDLRRIELERQRERMAAGDTPSGMTQAFVSRAEKMGQAHMVLGVGTRNNAPQDIALLGPNTLSKSSTRKESSGSGSNVNGSAADADAKGKRKGKAKAEPQPEVLGADAGIPRGVNRTFHSPAPSISGTTSVVNGAMSSGSGSSLAPRAIKPAFAPISSSPSAPASAVPASLATEYTPHTPPRGGGGFKLELGKRKAPMDSFAASEAAGQQPPKALRRE